MSKELDDYRKTQSPTDEPLLALLMTIENRLSALEAARPAEPAPSGEGGLPSVEEVIEAALEWRGGIGTSKRPAQAFADLRNLVIRLHTAATRKGAAT